MGVVPLTPAPTPLPVKPGLSNFTIGDTTTGVTTQDPGTPYSGPVPYLANQYINITKDSLNIVANTPSTFIRTGSGNDAIDVSKSNGSNVLDGGGGSNFLVGGTGNDTFFVDDAIASPFDSLTVAGGGSFTGFSPIWSTVANFHSGDSATLWGIQAPPFKPANPYQQSWADGQGAAGFTGLTLHEDYVGPSVTSGASASLTLAGYTTADLTNGKLTVSYGHTPDLPDNPGRNYMYVHAN